MEIAPRAAATLGRSFEFVRHSRHETLREAAKKSGISMQYIHNIEEAAGKNVSREVFEKLATAYGMDREPDLVANLLLRAEITSALEQRGLPADAVDKLWAGFVGTAASHGYRLEPDIAEFIRRRL